MQPKRLAPAAGSPLQRPDGLMELSGKARTTSVCAERGQGYTESSQMETFSFWLLCSVFVSETHTHTHTLRPHAEGCSVSWR